MPLWMRIDVHYFNHPKVIQLHPLAQLLYLRAVGYCKLHLTDGLLSTPAIRSIACDLAASIEGADVLRTIDGWVSQMVLSGLFERTDSGISIHDFLEWNNSKQEVEFISHLRGKSGSKGGNQKQHNKQSASKVLANDVANSKQTDKQNPTHSTEYRVQSTEKDKEGEGGTTAAKKPPRALVTDAAWIQGLKDNSLYAGIDIDLQLRKCLGWFEPKGITVSRQRFYKWLVRAMDDKPISATANRPCQSRVQRGLELAPCNAPSVAMIGTRPVCQLHNKTKESHAN